MKRVVAYAVLIAAMLYFAYGLVSVGIASSNRNRLDRVTERHCESHCAYYDELVASSH